MIKKKQIKNLKKKKKNQLFSFYYSLWPLFMVKFLQLYFKTGKKVIIERALFRMCNYWKIMYSKEFFWDLTCLSFNRIWPYTLLKVKKHNKTVELPGLLKLEQRFYTIFKILLKLQSPNLVNWNVTKVNQNQNITNYLKNAKQNTLRNRRFLRYRW